jgi:hypothetical protein
LVAYQTLVFRYLPVFKIRAIRGHVDGASASPRGAHQRQGVDAMIEKSEAAPRATF